MYKNDKRIVITLDAGGTNLVFGAMQGGALVIDPITLPSNANNLDLCLANIVGGFRKVINALPSPPTAISFAFPGPACYAEGIIGGYLPNFPSFRDGVALGPMLEEKFGLPVFINNDGDLFAYGESISGLLPEINRKMLEVGNPKRFSNLLGYTFGTGFGIGMVINGKLNRGNNTCVETFCLRHKKQADIFVEEGVSIRAVKRVYASLAGLSDTEVLSPKEIFEIAEGTRPGNREAAVEAFREFGEIAGDVIASAVTLTDSLVVIGGGLTGARKYIYPALLGEMRSTLRSLGGDVIHRLPMKVFDLDDEAQTELLAKGEMRSLRIYGSDRSVIYDPMKCTGVATTRLGTSHAIAVGAYSFALNTIDGF